MKRDIPLGRILGIKVGFSWSVLVIAAIYVYILAQTQFPNQVFGLSTTAYWIGGVVAALLFFGCLLAHELGHALVAEHSGIKVKGITLWLLGGFAEMESEPQTAGSQFRIAAAGPLMNAVLAAAFYGIHYLIAGSGDVFAATTGTKGLAAVVCGWLAFINMLLAAFNLLPAAPLDGGHLLSAGLWAATGNVTTSRLWAARAGLVLGAGMAFYGITQFISQNSVNGIWLIFVGWWILDAARRDISMAGVERNFEQVDLQRIMRPNPAIIPGWLTIDHAVQRLPAVSPLDAFPVQGPDGRIVGLLTAPQISHADPWNRANTPIQQLAFPLDRLTWATTTDAALPALRRLAGTGVPAMLVVWPDGRVAGTVGQQEFARAMQATGRARVAAGR